MDGKCERLALEMLNINCAVIHVQAVKSLHWDGGHK